MRQSGRTSKASLTIGVGLLVRFGSIPPGIRGVIRFLALFSTFRLAREGISSLFVQLLDLETIGSLLIQIACLLKLG